MSLSLLCLNHYNPFGEKIKYANLLYNLFIFSPNVFSSCECHTPATARYCSGGVIGKPSWELANRKASKCVEKQKQTDKKKLRKKKKTLQKKNKCYSLLLNGFQKLLSSVNLWVTPGLETCQLCQAFQSLFAHLERPITRPGSLIGFWECRALRHRDIIYYLHWYEIKWYNISTYIHICFII